MACSTWFKTARARENVIGAQHKLHAEESSTRTAYRIASAKVRNHSSPRLIYSFQFLCPLHVWLDAFERGRDGSCHRGKACVTMSTSPPHLGHGRQGFPQDERIDIALLASAVLSCVAIGALIFMYYRYVGVWAVCYHYSRL